MPVDVERLGHGKAMSVQGLHEGILLERRKPREVHPRGVRLPVAHVIAVVLHRSEARAAEAVKFEADLRGLGRHDGENVGLLTNADLDAEALGYSVNVFAFVGLTSQAESDLQDFEDMVSAWPQVRECHMLMGETDFLLKIVAHDWDDFQKFLTSRLTPAPNVSHVKTALAIRSAKNMPGVPIDGIEG